MVTNKEGSTLKKMLLLLQQDLSQNQMAVPNLYSSGSSLTHTGQCLLAVAALDPGPHPAPAGVAAIRDLPPHALALATAAAFLLAPGYCPEDLRLQRRAVVFEVIESVGPDYSCRYIRASGMLYSSGRLFGHHQETNSRNIRKGSLEVP